MIEKKIKENLLAFQRAGASGDGQAIAATLAELDRLTAEHGRRLHPQLLHFLQRRSYEKALKFLGGENGIPENSRRHEPVEGPDRR